MSDLFSTSSSSAPDSYDASSIEVLEGLEPVRRRPGMYIGGTDERALHHLAAEVIDNAMDEAVAGHASRIEVTLEAGNRLTVTDNGRGIPVEEHPKYPGKSALEVIMTTLHSGGKFEGKAYSTSRRPARRRRLGGQCAVDRDHRRGRPRQEALPPGLLQGPSRPRSWRSSAPPPTAAAPPSASCPTPEIFGAEARFDPARLYQLARSKAYLFAGVEIRWRCDPSLASRGRARNRPSSSSPAASPTTSPSSSATANASPPSPSPAARTSPTARAACEWAVAWPLWSDGAESYYCNTIPTPDGGTHEAGLRAALTKGMRAFGELVGNKKAKDITADDVFNGVELMLSVFIRNPHFQSQTKDRLTSLEAARFVEAAVRDHFDHFLADNMDRGRALLGAIVERMDERLKRRAEREVKRKTATSRAQAAPARQAHRLRQ